MTQLHVIGTPKQLLKALGGVTEVAAIFGLGEAEVTRWRTSGHIPNGWHYRLDLMARDRNLAVSPVVFGVPEGWIVSTRSRTGGFCGQSDVPCSLP